jgi:HK97 gp10 family phage protein
VALSGIQLKGASSLANKFKLIVPKTRAAVRDAVSETLLLVETDAKLMSAVDTGYNRANIHADQAPNGLSGTVTASASYAVFLENGTVYQKAQPFLGPAFVKNRGAFIARLKAAGLTAK